jgi:hypothetical protein
MKVPFSERVTMHPDFPRMISVYSCCLHVIMKSTPFVQKGPRWVIYDQTVRSTRHPGRHSNYSVDACLSLIYYYAGLLLWVHMSIFKGKNDVVSTPLLPVR